MLAYIDAFWIVAWVLTASLLLIVFLQPPPPNHSHGPCSPARTLYRL